MKRFNLPLTACVLIVLSVLLVSCVQQAPGTVESAETVELELMLAPEGVFGDITPESYSMQLLADRTGFNFAFRQIPREFLGERIATTLASGDLPDIMQLGLPADSTGTPMAIAHEFGPQGLFVSLSEYIAAGDMPNLVAEMERQPDMEKLMTSPDGNIYAVPQVRRLRQLRPWLQLRADLLEQCGIIKDRWNGNWGRHPDAGGSPGGDDVPAGATGRQACPLQSQRLHGPCGQLGQMDGHRPDRYYNPYTELYEYGPLMARFRSMVEFMNWMWENGVLHPEMRS